MSETLDSNVPCRIAAGTGREHARMWRRKTVFAARLPYPAG
ncbi:hypothetical protein [Nocardia sp. NPDC002869]